VLVTEQVLGFAHGFLLVSQLPFGSCVKAPKLRRAELRILQLRAGLKATFTRTPIR
jgi:hypothetical protein